MKAKWVSAVSCKRRNPTTRTMPPCLPLPVSLDWVLRPSTLNGRGIAKVEHNWSTHNFIQAHTATSERRRSCTSEGLRRAKTNSLSTEGYSEARRSTAPHRTCHRQCERRRRDPPETLHRSNEERTTARKDLTSQP